jgi:hypothetical protein
VRAIARVREGASGVESGLKSLPSFTLSHETAE